MKKIFLAVCFFGLIAISRLYASDDLTSALKELDVQDSASETMTATDAETQPMPVKIHPKKSSFPAASSEKIVNLDLSQAQAQIRELERRLSDLERQSRFQDDRIQSLDRSVDDLKRHH